MNKVYDDWERMLRLSHFTIEQAPDAILWIDSDGHIHRVNDAVSRLFGFSRSELIGAKSVRNFSGGR